MTALAQRHEISIVVRTTVSQRTDVMHFLRGCQPSFLFTLFAQRMRLDVLQPYPAPCSAVTLVGVGISLVFVVMVLSDLPVFVAVPTVGQHAATRIGAGTLGFSWHALPPGTEKSLRVRCEGPQSIFCNCIISQVLGCETMRFSADF